MVTQASSNRLTPRRRWGRAVGLLVAGIAVLVLSVPARNGGGEASAGAPIQRAVVLSTRALAAGTLLQGGDVREAMVADAPELHVLPARAADVVGRVTVVALAPGALLTASVTSAAGSAPGQRLVSVVLDPHATDGDMHIGDTVDVLAVAAQSAQDQRVIPVASGVVMGMRQLANAGAGGTLVTIGCDAASATRIIWAENFAKQVRLLQRPAPAGPVPAAVTGLAS